MVDVTISLVGSNGDSITLADNGDFVLATGVTGFGIPLTQVRIDPSAGDGGTWRHTKRGIRELDLPVVILGTDRGDVETKQRRLAKLLQDTNGPTRIVADYSNGDSVYLEAHYTGGAETQFGTDGNYVMCRWVLTMQAPQPYWQTSVTQSFSVTAGDTGRGLLPQLTKLKVSSSQTLGVVIVDNEGDVEVYPTWTIRGPVTGLVISAGSQSFSFPDPILSGDTYTVNTAEGTVTNNAGENIYYLLGSAPKLFSLPPGQTTVSVTGTDASPDTRITCLYSPRYEVVY